MAGVSIVELMVGLTLGLMLLAALAALFANSSRSRNEMERSSRQIENGRFAIELLSDDLRLAGFYGELAVGPINAPSTLPDPCSADPTIWATAIRIPMQGYDTGAGVPGCVSPSVKPGTDVLVVRRVASCEAGVAGCPGPALGAPYLQSSKCDTQLSTVTYSDVYTFGLYGTATFDRKLRNCATDAALRRYIVNIYFVSTDNGQGQNIPTLKRMEFNGINFVETPLVEGIEELNFEYGLDLTAAPGDGQPDVFTADPTAYACGTCTAASNWANVVAVRINLLARNIEASPAFADPKTYTVGLDASGAPITVAPHDGYRRHAYSTTVRVVNVSQRRESP